jgi:hypothetical protein
MTFRKLEPLFEGFCYEYLIKRMLSLRLKVPKCEIFDRSDFPAFYTIKSLRVGDFGVEIKKFVKKYLGVHLGVQSSFRVYAQSIFKEVFF